MKLFIRNTLLFLLPLAVAGGVLGWREPEREVKYQALGDDCFHRGEWLWSRVFRNDEPADMVFIGSSRTVNGVDDEKLTWFLSGKAGKEIRCLNLGYCRLGRNLDYVILKDILSRKHPATVVIEVRENENPGGHPLFPYLAESPERFSPSSYLHARALPDAAEGIFHNWNLWRHAHLRQQHDTIAFDRRPFGFTTHTEKIDEQTLRRFRERRRNALAKGTPGDVRFHRLFNQAWLTAMGQLSQQHQARIIFLYIPNSAVTEGRYRPDEDYARWGDFLQPPDSLLAADSLWYDENHLNASGSDLFTRWLAEALSSLPSAP